MLFFLILDLFVTSIEDSNISETSSYLDLGPLYGSCQTDQDAVRTFIDGKLKPDCFSQPRVLGFPPGVSAFLICFNRFHNYVVGELAAINEAGRFTMPVKKNIEAMVRATMPNATEEQIVAAVESKYSAALGKRDNDLFQTGRLYSSSKSLLIKGLPVDYTLTLCSMTTSVQFLT